MHSRTRKGNLWKVFYNYGVQLLVNKAFLGYLFTIKFKANNNKMEMKINSTNLNAT